LIKLLRNNYRIVSKIPSHSASIPNIIILIRIAQFCCERQPKRNLYILPEAVVIGSAEHLIPQKNPYKEIK
jgi:hypothetical protein